MNIGRFGWRQMYNAIRWSILTTMCSCIQYDQTNNGKKINSHYQESARKWEKQANAQNYIKKHFGIHQIVLRFFFSLQHFIRIQTRKICLIWVFVLFYWIGHRAKKREHTINIRTCINNSSKMIMLLGSSDGVKKNLRKNKKSNGILMKIEERATPFHKQLIYTHTHDRLIFTEVSWRWCIWSLFSSIFLIHNAHHFHLEFYNDCIVDEAQYHIQIIIFFSDKVGLIHVWSTSFVYEKVYNRGTNTTAKIMEIHIYVSDQKSIKWMCCVCLFVSIIFRY